MTDNTTYADLQASAKTIGVECATENRDYYLCKESSEDPTLCLAEGAAATKCGSHVLTVLKSACADPFEGFKECLVENRGEFQPCRKAQWELESCFAGLKK